MTYLRRSLRVSTTAFIIGLLTTSCSETRQSQCKKLITVANQAVQEVQTIIKENPNPDGTAYLNMSKTVERAKTDMVAIALSDEQLRTFQQRFTGMYSAIGASARALATAVDKQDSQAAESAQKVFEAATEQEEPLVNEVNAYCNPQG